MSGAKRILPLLAVLCFALFLLYGVYFNAFGANAESMMAFFGITESRQGFVMTIQSLGGIVMTVLLGLFGERLHKLYGLLAGAVLVGVAGVTIGTMPLYGNDSYGLLLVFALIGGVGYITIDLLMNGVIADVFPEKKSTLLPIVHGFYGLGAMLAPLLVTWLTDSSRPATFAVPYLVLGAAALVLAEGFPRQLIAIFGAANESSYYTDFAIKAFRVYLCMMVPACVNKACFIFLQAVGKALPSTLLSMFREVVFGVGFALLLPVFFGLDGVLYSMPVSDVLTFLISAVIIGKTYRELNA